MKHTILSNKKSYENVNTPAKYQVPVLIKQ